MRRLPIFFALLGFLLGGVSCAHKEAPPAKPLQPAATVDLRPFFDPAWGSNVVWDDGQAELARYSARRMQYRKLREFDAVLITVKEDFNQKFYVKADSPYEGKSLLPVFKLNIVQHYDTEFYPYRFLTSVFVSRSEPSHLVKLAGASQEWCGNTFKEVKTWGPSKELVYHSYFDGQGDGSYPLDLRTGDLLEDQLPVSLRALRFRAGLEFRTRILPSLVSNRANPVKWENAEVRVVGEENLATPAGQIPSWKVAVKTSAGESLYWFERAYPNILVKFAAPDGREFLLKARERRAYWPVLK